ncbi:hypothetical protein BCON_0153g00240 [Botryotinia convoluta]|uniref:Dienelactone hydrolase domain-containing protein n=1 Tax=Botryotinia convoluta TaxID=54673 RepID=A0A4Z1I5G0_9HELO|nr:hypothetical protein BCON_0153g00240 [Botryotinia convoluta]
MNVLKERDEVKNVKSWGVAGYCWGAKIVTMASQEGTTFKAGAQTHPSLVDPEDANLVTIPQIVLLSKDENKEQCKAYENNVKVEKYFEAFDDQVHGWMSSMGDLENPRTREEYYRGYKLWSDFFAKYL